MQIPSLVTQAVFLLASSTALHAQTRPAGVAPLTPEDQARFTRMLQEHRAWGPRAGTPGASLTLLQEEYVGSVSIELKATGLPPGKTYRLISWPADGSRPKIIMEGLTLSRDGIAVCSGKEGEGQGNKKDDPIDLITTPIRGEPVRFALISTDGKAKVFGKSVPLPLIGVDSGCSVSATLLRPHAELILFEAAALSPSSDISILSDSGVEHVVDTQKSDADGKLSTVVLPFVVGLYHGTVTVTVKSSKCSPSVKVAWGKNSEKQ